jgi:hypothetical protein
MLGVVNSYHSAPGGHRSEVRVTSEQVGKRRSAAGDGSRRMRILSSVAYRLPFMLGPFSRPQTNISSGSKKRGHVSGEIADNDSLVWR